MADKGTTLTDRLIAIMNTVVDDINTKVGENTDAAGTTTLFARLRQIVDNYLEKGLLNGTGTVLPDDKSIYDFLLTTDTAGTHDITTANDKTETDVVEIPDTTRYGLSIYFDLSTLVTAGEGGTVTIKMYNKIDESTYRQIGSATFIVGSTLTHPNFSENRLNHNVKFTIECSTDVTVTRQINYRYIKEPKE